MDRITSNYTHTIGEYSISLTMEIDKDTDIIMAIRFNSKTFTPTLVRIGEWLKGVLVGKDIRFALDIHHLDIMEWLDLSVMEEEKVILCETCLKGCIEDYKNKKGI